MGNEPEAYKIGWVPFINTKICLDSHPLIPRTETEYWVFEAIKELRSANRKKLKVLDLCAGSGCIGVAVLKDVPQAQVDFAEIDESHHSLIRANSRINDIEDSRAKIFGGDLFENISNKYDFIITNPPYVDKSLDRVAESVREHEPALALYGGAGGLEIIDRIIAQVDNFLTPGGILYLEHEPEHVKSLATHPLYIGSYPDQFGVMRFSKFLKGK